MPQVLTDGEKFRRAEYVRDAKAASAQGLLHDEFVKTRDKNVSEWCAWLHSEMDKMNASDPTEILPQLAARIEQRCAAAARAAAKIAAKEVVNTMFAKAISK